MNPLSYWLTRFYVSIYVAVKNIFGFPWRPIKGVYMPLFPKIGFDTLRWIVNGRYEEGEIDIIQQKLSKTDRVMEIGAGLGFISTFCAKVAGSGNVFSFEANPLNIQIAKLVYQKNKVLPNLQNALLSDSECSIDFPINRKRLLASSLLKASSESVKVPQLNINEVIKDVKPTFLIMDIEGAEYDVIRIMQFQSIQKIQVELHPAILGDVKIEEIFSILKTNGFIAEISIPDGRNYYFTRVPTI
jgi:FkbM family methyltransferase